MLPPNFFRHAKPCPRVIRSNKLIEEKTYKAIEVHPSSTWKALRMPLEDKKITKKA